MKVRDIGGAEGRGGEREKAEKKKKASFLSEEGGRATGARVVEISCTCRGPVACEVIIDGYAGALHTG